MILTPEKVPEKYFAYDTQEKKFFNYITYNDDYSYKKKKLYIGDISSHQSKGELCSTINASELARTIKGES